MELNDPVAFADAAWEPLLRLAAATLAGFLLGIDREVRGYGAGLRTHALACLGAAFMTVTGIGLYLQIGGEQPSIDPLRVIEGTASALGILAAALVFLTGGKVRNLTTAVHLWVAGVIGIAFGAGQYPHALAGVVLAVLVLTAARGVEDRWFGNEDHGQG